MAPDRARRVAWLILAALVQGACALAPQGPGQVRRDAHGIAQVWVPAGSFVMGESRPDTLDPPPWAARELGSEQPAHRVTISQGFWLDRDETSNAAFAAFVADGGYRRPELWSGPGRAWLARQDPDALPLPCPGAQGADHPRACVTWYEAQAYAHWRGGRLPTEAQWEYAARGPGSPRYPWGEEFDPARANVNGIDGTVPVGRYPGGASWVGARDMAGNVMEWVADWLDTDYYACSPDVDPPGPAWGRVKVEKGGWWGSHPFVARASYRHFEDPPDYQDHHIGLRVLTPAGAGN